MPLKLIYPKAVPTPPPPGHLPFIFSSTLRTHLAPRHLPCGQKTVAVYFPEYFFSGTALTYRASAHTMCPKEDTKLVEIVVSNLNRFSKFFH